MKRMNEILTEIVNSPFTENELISMFDDFTPDAERVFFAIGMFMKSNQIEKTNSQTDVLLTSL